MRARPQIVPFIVLFAAVAGPCYAQSLEEAMAAAPEILQQPDGVLYLNAESAALIKWIEKQCVLVNGGGGMLKVENGRIKHWGNGEERPAWRLKLLQSGGYKVVVNRTTSPGREGSASIQFFGKRRSTLTRFLEKNGAGAVESSEFGEVELEAGEVLVEFNSTMGTVPFEFSQVYDIRLIPLEAVRKFSRPAQDVLRKLDVDSQPELKALIAKSAALKAELDLAAGEARRKDFSAFTDLKQFIEFDRAVSRVPDLDREFKSIARQIADGRLAAGRGKKDALAKLKPEERDSFEAYAIAVDALKAAETRSYPKVQFPPVEKWQIAGRKPLFATGHFEDLPFQGIDDTLPVATIKVLPPPDAEQRKAAFAERNTERGLASLCDALRAVLIPGTPGLEPFERNCKDGRPREALEAYRAYFFSKLAEPEKFGAATQNILFELTRDRGRRELLRRPRNVVLERNMNNTAVVQLKNEVIACEVGTPGAACWVPHGLSIPDAALKDGRSKQASFWQTPAGKDAQRSIEFFRYINCLPGDRDEYYSGGVFPALIWSYAISGNKAHLARWCEYADDWTQNSLRDQDDFSYGMRMATDLEPQFPRCMLNLMRIILDERPEFARDFDAATLARLMMKLVSDYVPYVIRCRRAEMANWGIMSLSHQLHLCRFLSEFKAMAYFNRETWRLWSANMIQHQTLDGENFEAWDEGHNFVNIGFALDGIPFGKPPGGMDALDLAMLWDHVKVDARSKLVHISPSGNYWPDWEVHPANALNTLRAKGFRPDAENRYYLDLIAQEPDARSRIQTMLGSGSPADVPLPDRYSDISPYAGMSFLRENWNSDADYFILQNFPERSQQQDDCSRTMYSLSRNDRILVEAHALVVDRKPDNRYFGKLRTGGKTDYCGQAGRHVADSRFHTSARFDFSEGRQDAPYANHRRSYSDAWGLYRKALTEDDPDPIRDVTVLRQIFGVRGADVWIACDRIQNPATKEREFTQFFALPVRVATQGFADRVRVLAQSKLPIIETHAEKQRIRTMNPGFENVSIYCFAPSALSFANTLNGKGEHEIARNGPLENLQVALAAGKPLTQLTRKPAPFPVSVRWKGAGEQVFITALCSRSAEEDIAATQQNDDACDVQDLKGAEGAQGCRITTRTGMQIWFQSGPRAKQALNCGPVNAQAETLLVVQDAQKKVSGIALGCSAIAWNGHPVPAPPENFEFEITPEGELRAVATIHKPIDTVHILPDENVFTSHTDVSFEIPTQAADGIEFRYTLDGSDPTVESALFTKPIRIDATTLVKVRPFRAGVKVTPWTFSGTDSGKTVSAIFRKRAMLPARRDLNGQAGLKCEYFEGAWPKLFSYAGFDGILSPKSSGQAPALLDPKHLAALRSTDRAYAVRYEGAIKIPKPGVYKIHAPLHLYTPTMDAGYDLRVFIDEEEWFLSPTLHCENVWCVPLEEGAHLLRVAFTDYRWKIFRNDYWMAWQEEQMWQGIPVLEIEGPDLKKQPLPDAWFVR